MEDMLKCGRNMDISTIKCKNIIEGVRKSVSKWMEVAEEAGVGEKMAEHIQKIMKQSLTDSCVGKD